MIRLRVGESRPVGHPHQLHTYSLCRDSHPHHCFRDRNPRASYRNRHAFHFPQTDCSRSQSSDADSSCLPMAVVRLPSLGVKVVKRIPSQSLDRESPRDVATVALSRPDVVGGRSRPASVCEALVSDRSASNNTLTNSIKRDSAQEAASSRTSR